MEKQKLLAAFTPITLEEMSTIRLMNRIDTKYLLTTENLFSFLRLAVKNYLIQEVDGERDIAYYTVYLDTPMREMYLRHECGRAVREKIRVRTYVSSHLTFLEVKNKNNKGRTDKKRIPVTSVETLSADGGDDFLRKHAWYRLEQLSPQLENRFHRITLVNQAKSERLTIDCDIRFHNLVNGNNCVLDILVVVELKRDGRLPSPVHDILHSMHVHPSSFSKYCTGCALTDGLLRQNRFKLRLRKVMQFNNQVIQSSVKNNEL